MNRRVALAAAGTLGLASVGRSADVKVQRPVAQTGDAIQDALDALPAVGGIVHLPAGTFPLKRALRLRNNVTLLGSGFGTILQAEPAGGLGTALVGPKNPGGRSFGLFVRDLTIDNRAAEKGSVGIDFTRVSVGGIENVSICYVETGVRVWGAAFYNSFINILVSTASVGMDFAPITTGADPSGANENRVFGARMVEVDVGFDVEADNLHFFQCSIEGTKTRPFTRGFRLKPNRPGHSYTAGIGVYGARFENERPPGGDFGFEIGAGVTGTTIVAPYFGSVSTPVKDHGSLGTVILGDGRVVLSAPNGSKWQLSVDNNGKLATKQYQ